MLFDSWGTSAKTPSGNSPSVLGGGNVSQYRSAVKKCHDTFMGECQEKPDENELY